MLRRLYDWTMRLAGHRHANWAMAIVSFLESSIFPIPPDVVMMPMILAQRQRAFWIAGLCTGASVLGGIFGYLIGLLFFETLGQAIIDFYGAADKFATFQGWYEQWGGWIVFAAGVTPIPYKVFTIASGLVSMNLAAFIVASVLGRAVRFFAVAALLYYYGEPIRGFIERYLGPLFVLFVVLLFAGFVVLKYLA